MHFQFSFIVLLASFMIDLPFMPVQVQAAPAKRNAGMVTLPLKRLHQARDDIHPHVLHQLHLNRGHKRLARMTGCADPSREELAERLHKRLLAVGITSEDFVKRFNRDGYPKNRDKRFNRYAYPKKPSIASVGIPEVRPVDERRLSSAEDLQKLLPIIEAMKAQNLSSIALGPEGTIEFVEGPAVVGVPVTDTAGDKQVPQVAEPGKDGAVIGKEPPQIIEPQADDPLNKTEPSVGTGSGQGGGGSSVPLNGTDIGGPAAVAALNDDRLKLANAPAADNSLGLHVELNDVGYSATVLIGTPPREFLVLMDSGSADFWVGGENCRSLQGGGCGDHQFLGTNSSESFVGSRQPWTIEYGTGSVSGVIVKDTINLAGLALNNHTFGVALQESVEFSSGDTPFDGLMGLARSELSTQGTLTPIEALKAGGLIREAITSYKISRAADEANDGQITFGGLDETKFDAASLQVLSNVSPMGFWEAKMPSISVGGQKLNFKGRTAILDTGTTLIIAPPADARAVHQAIPGSQEDPSGAFIIPCDTQATVAITFGTTDFAIDARDLAFAPVDAQGQSCISGISAGLIGADTQWLVGDVFLKNAYFSHNVDENTMTLAKLA